jgi:hypothetical protein
MGQNLARQRGELIRNHFIVVVDLAESTWDWEKDGEPPVDNPAYYLRYCKSFARMGGTLLYLRADNRGVFSHCCRRCRCHDFQFAIESEGKVANTFSGKKDFAYAQENGHHRREYRRRNSRARNQ